MEQRYGTDPSRRYGTGVWNGCGPEACSGPPILTCTHFEVKMHKAHHPLTAFGSWDVEKVHAVVARSAFRSENVHQLRATFGRSDVVSRGRRKGLCSLSKVRRTWWFCSMSKNDGSCGAFEEDLQRCILRGRRCTRDMFIRAVRGSGRWFPERGCILEHQIFRFADMILHDRCSTLAEVLRFWRCQLQTLVSQNCFVFDVVKFKNWGRLAELLRFRCCQVQKLRKSRRIASFSSLQIDR